jgi:hypothetical protein
MTEGSVMERDRVTSGELRGSYVHQSVLSAEALEIEIEQAFDRGLPTFDVQYETEQGHRGTLRLLLLEEIAQRTDAGVIYSFLLSSGSDNINQREITILIPSGDGRAIISLPY